MTASPTANRIVPVHVFAILLSGAVVIGLAIHTLYPGWYTFDSAYILYQARTGTFSDLQPPMMGVAWRHLIASGAPPGSLLIANLAAYIAGSIMLGLALRRLAGVLFPALLLWPPFLAMFGHLWIDVNMAASLVLAAGWIAWTRSTGRVHLSWLSAIALTYAVCVRHNAVFCVLPFYYVLISQTPRLPVRSVARVALAVFLTLGSYGVSMVFTTLTVEKSVPKWSPTAIWDLSAVSVASGQMLLPAGMRGPALALEELRPIVNPHESVSILVGTRSGINSGIVEPLPESARRDLLIRWICLPFTHTKAYLGHRMEVARSLFGIQPVEKPAGLFVDPTVVPFRDNPAIERNDSVANAALLQIARSMRNTLWCAPASYLLLSLVAMGLTLRPGYSADRGIVTSLVLSAWFCALPLVVLVPSSDWRYALWPTLSASLGFLFAVAGSLSPLTVNARTFQPPNLPPSL